jgi:hypothetical protein
MRELIMVMSHAGLGTKNDCAGEGWQQFVWLASVYIWVYSLYQSFTY